MQISTPTLVTTTHTHIARFNSHSTLSGARGQRSNFILFHDHNSLHNERSIRTLRQPCHHPLSLSLTPKFLLCSLSNVLWLETGTNVPFFSLPFPPFSLSSPQSFLARSTWVSRMRDPLNGAIFFEKTRYEQGGGGFWSLRGGRTFRLTWHRLVRWVKRVFSSVIPQMHFPENISPQCTNPNRLLTSGIREKLTCWPVDSTITLQMSWLMENR